MLWWGSKNEVIFKLINNFVIVIYVDAFIIIRRKNFGYGRKKNRLD